MEKMNMKKTTLIKIFLLTSLMAINIPAFATGDITALTDAIQGLIDILTGTTAKLLAVVAIAGVGYLYISGRLSLQHAAYVGLGIGVIFGAPDIASMLGAG